MTMYVLESCDARGHYYVADYPPTKPGSDRHPVTLTNRVKDARAWDTMTAAIVHSAYVPGRWSATAIECKVMAA